jgi:hypothetical protein
LGALRPSEDYSDSGGGRNQEEAGRDSADSSGDGRCRGGTYDSASVESRLQSRTYDSAPGSGDGWRHEDAGGESAENSSDGRDEGGTYGLASASGDGDCHNETDGSASAESRDQGNEM